MPRPGRSAAGIPLFMDIMGCPSRCPSMNHDCRNFVPRETVGCLYVEREPRMVVPPGTIQSVLSVIDP